MAAGNDPCYVEKRLTWMRAERIGRLNASFEAYHSGDEYDREAITHVMACSSHFAGYLIKGYG